MLLLIGDIFTPEYQMSFLKGAIENVKFEWLSKKGWQFVIEAVFGVRRKMIRDPNL